MKLHPEYPLQIIPKNFGVKFNPPKLGLEYFEISNPMLQQIYEITLQPLLDKGLSADDIVSTLFKEHKGYLHPKVIAREQLKKLVDRVIAKVPKAKK